MSELGGSSESISSSPLILQMREMKTEKKSKAAGSRTQMPRLSDSPLPRSLLHFLNIKEEWASE